MPDNVIVLTSRFTFPEDRTSFVYQRPGMPILTPARTGIKIFTDEAGQFPADIQTLAGNPVQYSTLYTGDDSLLPEFLGPQGFVSKLWARVVGGTGQTYPLMAQYSDQLAILPSLAFGNGPPPADVGAVGSFYIDQGLSGDINEPDQPVLYGPRTIQGWPSTGQVLIGPPGPPGAARTWVQNEARLRWEIPHTIAYLPSVTVTDSSGTQIFADVSYPTPTLVWVDHGVPTIGKATLS